MTTWGRRLAIFCSLTLFGLGLYWTLRLGYADFLAGRSAEDLARATSLVPLRHDYWMRRAAFKDGASQEARHFLETAAKLNPREAQVWIDLGRQAELTGDFPRAERCLLEAARVSKQFDPRWALVNYYCRRGDDRFWPWARKAFLASYGDRTPLFELCSNCSDSDDDILSRAIPDNHQILDQYLYFLLTKNQLDSAETVVRKLLERASADDVPILLLHCNILIENGRLSPALALWNALVSKQLVPYDSLVPEAGKSLTNGNFVHAPLRGAFDWTVPRVDGVEVEALGDRQSLEILLNGQQPENSEVLSQFLPLMPLRNYQLRFEYELSSMESVTGLQWSLMLPSRLELSSQSPRLSNKEWKQETVGFSTMADTRLVRLALIDKRVSGSTRTTGTITLRKVTLSFTR